jgi:hypothetical protein
LYYWKVPQRVAPHEIRNISSLCSFERM